MQQLIIMIVLSLSFPALSKALCSHRITTAHRWVPTSTRRTMATTNAAGTGSDSALIGKTCVSVQEAIEAHSTITSSSTTKFVDGSWFLQGRNARQEYEAGPRIQGAQFFDIDDISNKHHPKKLPHMMPPANLFAAAMDAMGITNDDHIILYGSKGCMTTHRAWFQMKSMGHDVQKFHLMQGNLGDWIELGGPIEEGSKSAILAKDLDLTQPTAYQARNPVNVVDMQQVLDIIQDGTNSDYAIVDVRAKDRFLGLVEEPRPNMRLGHMPGAFNLPFVSLLDPNDMTRLKSQEDIQQLLQEAGIPSDKKLVLSCGSGATACCLAAALEVCGRTDYFVYDGSWAEWGGEQDTPIVKE